MIDLRLIGQVAVVTDGGGAIALAYGSVGADVVIADTIPQGAEEAAEHVRAFWPPRHSGE